MPEKQIIEQQITAILKGSGVPMDRREEVADELRVHLDQLISAKLDEGLTQEQAVESALADFGYPDVIRRQLRKQQRMLDRRYALDQIRHVPWWMLIGCGFFTAIIVIFAPAPDSAGMRWLCGVVVFMQFLLSLSFFGYLFSYFGRRLKRRRPRQEYRFLTGMLQWSAAIGIGMFAVCVLGLGPIRLIVPLCYANPEFHPLWLVGNAFIGTCIDSPVRLVLIALLIGYGLGLALYERSRCVDEPAAPVVGQ
ncbi:MAG: permease prefix domain 1-containing protein [Planctomycetota bacterium]|jgi:amino acid transporter